MPDEMDTPSAFGRPEATPNPRPPGVVSPPPSSGSSLFLKICFALGSIVLIGSCAALLSPTGREVTRSTFNLMSSVGGAAAAPGTNALREIGCATALVMPFEAILNPMAKLSIALGEPEETRDDLDGVLFVQCSPNLLQDEDLTCEQIARTYGEASSATEEFVVLLERAGETACMGFYLPDGTLSQALDSFEEVPGDAF